MLVGVMSLHYHLSLAIISLNLSSLVCDSVSQDKRVTLAISSNT